MKKRGVAGTDLVREEMHDTLELCQVAYMEPAVATGKAALDAARFLQTTTLLFARWTRPSCRQLQDDETPPKDYRNHGSQQSSLLHREYQLRLVFLTLR